MYTIEIVPELARWAATVFAARGYTSIAAREGDGYRGWPEEAPFDAIVVT
ncbi:MAG TPA: protein-L-isoaspartate O-methyltransferase, partial [Planctomycetota bacterium]|nr:protein-L-isoaspartate O-methyltransferase [Planctomycetota bacterium]